MLILGGIDKIGNGTGFKGQAIMEGFITMEPKEVTSNSCKDLKTMPLQKWNMEQSIRV
jgi:hypothetical protein